MQVARFSNGGFVLHKALGGRTSAWFDVSGNLLDAEFRDIQGRTRPVARNSSRWTSLASLGRVYKEEAA
jgi:hypothetical protein